MFKFKEHGSDVRTEIVAGLTTFMTMSYIVALNPNILTNFGADGGQPLWNAVFMATCLASAIGTICMAFYADKPFVMAPGMGLNSFFAVVVANIAILTGLSYTDSFQSALCIILIEGVLFIVLSLIRVREKIVEAIPLGIRMGIGPAIGLMLMNIGFGSNAGIYSSNGGPFYVMRDFYLSHRDECRRFAEATRKGWEWAAAHPEEAMEIVMKYVHRYNSPTNSVMQKLMFQETLRLQIDRDSKRREFRVRPDMVEKASQMMLESGMIKRRVTYKELTGQ